MVSVSYFCSLSLLKGDHHRYLVFAFFLSFFAAMEIMCVSLNLLKLFRSRSKVTNNPGKVGWQTMAW